jgi:hypothetical protein
MTLNQLLTFLAVGEHGSVRAAAQDLMEIREADVRPSRVFTAARARAARMRIHRRAGRARTPSSG